MRYRKLTADGDFSFGSGQADYYRDVPEAVGQAVATRLKLWLGEWFLDLNQGTPYMEGIFGKHQVSAADATIQQRVRTTEGFVSTETYESALDPEARKLQISTTINTVYGPTRVEIANLLNY